MVLDPATTAEEPQEEARIPGSILDIVVPLQHRERKVTIGTSLPVSVAAMIDDLAERDRISTSAVVRLAVLNYLRARGFDTDAIPFE